MTETTLTPTANAATVPSCKPLGENPRSAPNSITTKTAEQAFRALLKACKAQVPAHWEGEKDAWINGYNQAVADNIRIAKDFLKGMKL